MSRHLWVAVTIQAGSEEAEAFGPFTSAALAEKFVDDYDMEGVRPAYPLMVVELYPVREGLRQVREAKRENAEYDR